MSFTLCPFHPAWRAGAFAGQAPTIATQPPREAKMDGYFHDRRGGGDELQVRRFFLTKTEQSFSFVRNKNNFTGSTSKTNLENKYSKH
jgi:hypothetical protein